MNRFNGYQEFLARWHMPGGQAAPPLRQSAVGNRNLSGSAVDTAAYSFVPGQPGFRDSIEPGIRPLVLYLVEQVGLVTYSSCEAHPSTCSSPFRAAHVGLLHDVSGAQRSAAFTAEILVRWLEEAAYRTMRSLDRPAVGVRVIEDVLDTELGPRPCLDVWFLPIKGTAQTYFAHLPALVEAYRQELARLLRIAEAGAGARMPAQMAEHAAS
jgi:uncharacterized protein